MNIRIETERLILRPFQEDDVDRLFLLDSNPEVMKYVGQKPLTKKEQSAEVIKMVQKQYAEKGIGRWAVIEKESNLLIGWSGLKLIDYEINGHQNFYEIGYRFLPEFWGKGYATESVNPFVKMGFSEFKAEKLYAYADVYNLASLNVLKKIGFKEKGTFIDDTDGVECIWYEISRE